MNISHYRILDRLGEGGMGEVFRAEDSRLGRRVAIKVLPKELASEPVALDRFRREARTASALNHPNICTVFDIGDNGGAPFMVMELLEGKTIRDRLKDGQIPLDEILRFAIDVADGLAAAHQQDILHRDIKPANLFITTRGPVKILDFGLAKLSPLRKSVAAGVETDSQHLTKPGALMGTVAYMSPEQALGTAMDARADLFSFGIVMYEMAAGVAPFKGETSIATCDAILHSTPIPVREKNAAIPPDLEAVIEKALEKDKDLRYQSATELRADLKRLQRKLESGATGDIFPPSGGASERWSNPAKLALAAGLSLAAVAGWWFYTRSGTGGRQFSIKEATSTQLTNQPGTELFPSVSPDGKSFVFAANSSGRWAIYLQRIGGKNSIDITKDSRHDYTQPAYSPDGEHIALRSTKDSGGVFVMGATGESVRLVAPGGYNPTWSPDGKELAYSTEEVSRPEMRPGLGEIWRAEIETGKKRLVMKDDAVQPSWSPDGSRVAFWRNLDGQRDIWTVSAGGGAAIPVTNDSYMDWNPVWSPDGLHIYFSSDRGGSMNLWRIRVDQRTGKVLGEAEPITTPAPDSSHISFSRNGSRLAYVNRSQTENFQRVGFNALSGAATGPPSSVIQGSRIVINPDISPDGKRLAFVMWGKTEDIWVSNIDGGGMLQLTDDTYKDRGPRWSPDGSQIAFYSNRSGKYEAWLIRPDGSERRKLTSTPTGILYPVWAPDGRMIVSVSGGAPLFVDVASGQTAPVPGMENPRGWYEIWAWSADGKKLAGVDRRGSGEYVGVIVYDLESRQINKVTSGGGYPVWLNDSRRLIYPRDGKLFLVDSQTMHEKELLALAPPSTIHRLFALSRDNSDLVYSAVTTEADIWLLTMKP